MNAAWLAQFIADLMRCFNPHEQRTTAGGWVGGPRNMGVHKRGGPCFERLIGRHPWRTEQYW